MSKALHGCGWRESDGGRGEPICHLEARGGGGKVSSIFQVFQLHHLQDRLLPVISRIITPLMGCYCPSYPINRCFVLFCKVTTPFVTIGFSWPTVESLTLRLFIKCSALMGFRGSICITPLEDWGTSWMCQMGSRVWPKKNFRVLQASLKMIPGALY